MRVSLKKKQAKVSYVEYEIQVKKKKKVLSSKELGTNVLELQCVSLDLGCSKFVFE